MHINYSLGLQEWQIYFTLSGLPYLATLDGANAVAIYRTAKYNDTSEYWDGDKPGYTGTWDGVSYDTDSEINPDLREKLERALRLIGEKRSAKVP